MVAKIVKVAKISKTSTWATRNGGSFCVGANAVITGTFREDWTTYFEISFGLLPDNEGHEAATRKLIMMRAS
jgi:hypothetical protein